VRASQPLRHLSEQRIPTGQRGKCLRLRGSAVAALALERQDVLAKMIGQLDDGKQRARWHHLAIVASARSRSPSSAKALPTLYVARATEWSQQQLRVNADLKLTHFNDNRRSKIDPPWAPFSIKLMPFS
jgi:hypothetical protein